MKKFAYNLWECTYPIVIYYVISMIVSMALTTIISLSLMLAGNIMSDAEMVKEIYKYGLYMTGISAAITIPFLVLFKKRDDKKAIIAGNYVKYTKVEWYKYLLIIPLSFFVMFGANIFVTIITNFMPQSMIDTYDSTSEIINNSSIWLQIVVAGILGPIVEEYVFRGLVYARARRCMKPIWAGLISAFVFGVFHGNWIQLPYAFILGLVLAFLYEKYKGITAPIIFHCLANLLSVIISYIGTILKSYGTEVEMPDIEPFEFLIMYMPLVMIYAIISAVIMVVINMVVKPNKILDEVNTNEVIDSSNSML